MRLPITRTSTPEISLSTLAAVSDPSESWSSTSAKILSRSPCSTILTLPMLTKAFWMKRVMPARSSVSMVFDWSLVSESAHFCRKVRLWIGGESVLALLLVFLARQLRRPMPKLQRLPTQCLSRLLSQMYRLLRSCLRALSDSPGCPRELPGLVASQVSRRSSRLGARSARRSE